MSVSVEVSRKIYDYIISFLKDNSANGSLNSPILDKYRSCKSHLFKNASFDDFLKGPQNRESLVKLLEEMKRLYEYQNFYYSLDLFQTDDLVLEDKDKILISDLNRRLSLLESIFDLSKIQSLEVKLKEKELEFQDLKKELDVYKQENELLKDRLKSVSNIIRM